MAKKLKKEGMPISGGSILLAPGLQWGTIGGTINQSINITRYLTRHWADGPANYDVDADAGDGKRNDDDVDDDAD